jgi:hypothetical protein
MKLNDASITILVSENNTTIEIYDECAGVQFCEIELTSKQFCQALGRLAHTHCEIEVRGLEKLGKKMEHKSIEFECGENGRWNKNEEQTLNKLAKAACPEGWEPDYYFGSQGSFFTKDGKNFARCIIRRWV